jgi:hypothetical protein
VANASPTAERIRQIFRSYSSRHWSGAFSRGDLLIPQRELSQVIDEILETIRNEPVRPREASDPELFETLMEARRAPSVQDQMNLLRSRFRILHR